MQVSVINNREQRNINIPLAAAAGGAAGLALRQFFPVYKDEIDSVKFSSPKELQETNLMSAKKTYLDLSKAKVSKASGNKKEALILFNKRIGAKSIFEAKSAKEKIKFATASVKQELKVLNNEFVNVMKAAKQISETNMKNYVKQLRPFMPFVLPGAVIGAATAFAYNVIGKINEN